MSSRKRKDPNPQESPRTPSKRTRFQQATLQTPSKATSSGPACKYGTSRSAYAINGILDESEDKYLIDWAPDLAGNIWSPDWQPKKNANAAAVRLWETKKSIENNKTSDRRPRLTLTHKNTREHKRQTVSNSPVAPQAPYAPATDGKTHSEAIETQKPTLTSEQSQLSVQAISSSLDISKFPNFAVQIEPRGSLDKEAYIAYNSSLSNQETPRSARPHSDSGFEESSSRENSPFHRETEKGIIVPDSQSVPGSSSSVPTQRTLSGYAKSSQALRSTCPPESSSGIIIPASQPSKGVSERRESEPVPNLREISNPPSIELATPSLLQIASDPEALLDSSRAHRFIPRQRPNRRVIIDSPSPSRTSLSNHQPEVPLQSIEPIEDITQVQILGSEPRLPFGEEGNSESPEHSPVFVTQAPLDSGEQSSQTSSESPTKLTRTSVDPLIGTPDLWQAGQAVPVIGKAVSEISSGSLPQAKTQSEAPKEVSKVDLESVTIDDKIDQAYPLEDTTADEPSLGKKDSDSQLKGSSQDKGPEIVDTVEQPVPNLRSADNLVEVTELSRHPGSQLPDTIDSRVPPELPTSSDIDMSDNARGDGDPLAESHIDKMRRKLQEARATSDAKLAAQKAERMQSSISPTPPSPSLKRTEFEIKMKPAIAAQSLRGPKSPSLARIAVTPTGPLSPTALGSPLGIQITSPRSTRSPSKIPEREPYQPQEESSFLGVDPTEMAKDLPAPMMASQLASQSASNTSVRSGAQIADDITSTKSDSLLQTTSLNLQNLEPLEFVMPLSMPPRTQKQYIDTYRFFQRKISLFVEGQDVSQDIVEDLNIMLDRVAKVTTHMDLDGGGPGNQDEVDVVGEAGYAMSVSEKFRFLGYVLKLARDLDMHIGIVARPGQLCDFIETTLKAQRVNYFRPLDQEACKAILREFGSRLSVSLLASGMEEPAHKHLSRRADLLIAFDETFDTENPEVRALRDSVPSQDRLVPVIRLVVYATLEHINLCLPMTLEPNDRLRKLLYYMVHAEIAVGQLAPENLHQSPFDPSRCAEQLVEFALAGATSGTWTLPSIPPIEDLPVMDSDSSLSDTKSDISDTHKPEGKVRYWPNPVIPKTSPSRRILGEKRPFDLEYGDSVELQTKKMKMGILASNGRQAGHPETLQDLKNNERIKELEKQLQYAKANNYEPDNPMSWQSRVKIFDEANRERRELRATVADLNATIEKLTLSLATSKEEIATAKAALADTKAKSDALHDMLLNKISPDVQQAELTRRRLQELEAIDAAKSKKLANTENDLAFTRKVYQEASTAASTASSELASLRPHLKATEALLAGAQRERKNARAEQRNSLQPHLKEKAALKETLKQRDKELQAIKLELDGLKRGRQGVQTRGSSMQPVGARSPRGSRGVSPAVGGLVPGGHGPGHQGGVAMGRGPSGLGISSRFGGSFEGGKMR